MSERFTASEDKKGEWLVFDNEDFYCCYGTTGEYDAINEAIKLNAKNSGKDEISTLKDRIAELEQIINVQDGELDDFRGIENTGQLNVKQQLDIRDLQQQLKTADSFLNMAQTVGRFGRGAISEADAIRKRNKIFKELQALKEQG